MNFPAQPQADGYVTEIPYVAAYQRALNPSLQAMALNMRGVGAWQRGTPMTYMELGCGFGLSTLVHAATNPQATFIGVDVLPEHVATARALAQAAGLSNVTFIEGSFASLAGMDLPPCDFIAMHGVWSWISAENRAHILQCVDARLKPGGVLYVSYNALPGSAAAIPMRQLMMAGFTRAQGSIPQRIGTAIAMTDELKSVGGGFFADNPLAAHRFDELKTRPPNYLAHEYFNADWQAFYHKDLVASVKGLGLEFISQADPFMSIDEFHFKPAARAQINAAADPVISETLRDYLADREFRADLFVRRSDANQRVGDTRFFAAMRAEHVDLIKVRTTLGDVSPPRAPALAILTALQERPLTIDELAQHPACSGISKKSMNVLAFGLAAFAAIEPVMPATGEAERTESTRRFNRALWEKNHAALWTETNASPVTGGSIEVSREDQMYFLARAENVDPVGFTAKALGAPETEIRTRYRAFQSERLAAYQRLGIG